MEFCINTKVVATLLMDYVFDCILMRDSQSIKYHVSKKKNNKLRLFYMRFPTRKIYFQNLTDISKLEFTVRF